MSNPFAVETVRCAGPGCKHVRQEANHWFVVSVWHGQFTCWPFDKVGLTEEMQPVCGSACAQRLFEQFLSKK